MLQFSQAYGAQTEMFGSVGASSRGLALTGGTAGVKGSWVTVGTTTFTWEYLLVSITRASATADSAIDIGIDDGSGNVWVIAPNLRLCSRKATQDEGATYALPLHVPSGAQLRARVQSSQSSGTVDVVVQGFSNGPFGTPGFSRCVALYTLTAGTAGPAVDAGASANTKGAVREMVASTADRVVAVQGYIGANLDVSRTAAGVALLDIGIGAASSEYWHVRDMALCWSATTDKPVGSYLPLIPWDIPAGSRIAARMQCSDNTAGDRTIDLALWGFVP